MAHSWDIIAYTYDGGVYHADCIARETEDSDMCHPVFASDEFDLDGMICDNCRKQFTERDN